MAYKNRKKNKKHVRHLRVSQGDIAVKHYREKERNNTRWHGKKELTLEEIELLMKERGLI